MRVCIIDVSNEDAYWYIRDQLIGLEGRFEMDYVEDAKRPPLFYSGDFFPDNYEQVLEGSAKGFYFYAVGIEILEENL